MFTSLRRLATPLSASALALAAMFAAVPGMAQTSAVAAAPASQPADPAQAEKIRTAIANWTRGRYDVKAVRTTPIPGLFEIQIRTDLFFVDAQARYILIEGEMVDISTSRNLTQERMAEVMAINFEDLPIDKALKQVNGDGKRVLAVFEDPNCGYCKRLRADLMAMDNVTIYTFAYPILAADSDVKSRKALCASEPAKAWNSLMLQGVVPDNTGECANDLDQFKALGDSYGIRATPTIFFPNGIRLQGYAPPSRFVEALDKNQVAPAS